MREKKDKVPRAQTGAAGDHITAVRCGSEHQNVVFAWTETVKLNHLQQQEIEYALETLMHTSVSGLCGTVFVEMYLSS